MAGTAELTQLPLPCKLSYSDSPSFLPGFVGGGEGGRTVEFALLSILWESISTDSSSFLSYCGGGGSDGETDVLALASSTILLSTRDVEVRMCLIFLL